MFPVLSERVQKNTDSKAKSEQIFRDYFTIIYTFRQETRQRNTGNVSAKSINMADAKERVFESKAQFRNAFGG